MTTGVVAEDWEMRQLREHLHELSQRVSHLGERVSSLESQRVPKLGERVSSLEAWRDDVKARHSSTPAWVFGVISTVLSIITLLVGMWLAGVGP